MAVPGTDPAARELRFAEMVRAHQAGLWRYLRFLGCDAGRADDLVQETFLKVWARPFEDRGPGQTRGYLRRVARNLFIDAARRAKVRPAFRSLRDADAAWADFAPRDDGEAYLDALRRCLETVQDRARDVVTHFYRSAGSREEVARAAGLTSNGVKSILRRTRAALRECVERRMRR